MTLKQQLAAVLTENDEIKDENTRLRNQIENLLKPSQAKIAEQRDKLRDALTHIAKSCSDQWAKEIAESALANV